MHTLTRAAVAQRLGRSIATVRRLEYRVLFPVRDERGVLRFDEDNVERVRSQPESLRVFARSRWFEDILRDRASKSRVPAGMRRPSKWQPAPEASYSTLANELQQVLGELLLRFEGKQLRACGLDAGLFARALDVVRTLRAFGSRTR